MNIYHKLAVATSGFILIATAGTTPATAADFNFSYSGSNINGSVSANGVLTTGAENSANNSYQITGITGTRNGVSIDSLLPSGSSSYENNNDNLLLPSSPQVDFFGFSYEAGGETYNLFSLTESSSTLYGEKSTNGVIIPISFSATPTSVPEPSSIIGVLSVGVFIGGTLLRRKF